MAASMYARTHTAGEATGGRGKVNGEGGQYGRVYGAGLTDGSIYKDDEQTGVIYPLDLKPATGIFEFRKRRLYVACFELLWKTGQREDARDGGGKLRERGCH